MIEHFKDLSKDELAEFEKFVYSPYFSTQKNIVRLFEYLKKIYPDISEEDVSKKNISQNVYRERKVNDVKIRKLLSEFSIFMERFFVQIEIDKDEIRNRILLLHSLRTRGLTKRYEMNYKVTLKLLDNQFSKDEEYYINRINLTNELINNKFGDLKEEYNKSKQDKSDTLDYLFSFAKLHTFNEMYRSGGLDHNSLEYNRKFYTEVMTFVEENKEDIYQNHPNLFIIYCVVKMFENLDDNFLKELEDYLREKGGKFSKDKLSYYYHYVSQYYIQKINLGHIECRRKVFEIYKLMNDEDLFVKENVFSHLEFNNVSNISLSLNEFDWVENFIEEYKDHLEPAFAKDAYNLAKAKLLFYRNDYENIFQYLNFIEFKDPNYYSHSKFLLGRIHFNMKDITGAKYIIDNLKQYIRAGKSLTHEQKDVIKIYNYYLGELIKIFEGKSSDKKSLKVIFMKELDNEKKLVPNKSWFYDAVSKL